MIVHHQRFSHALAFIVATSGANRVDRTPVIFGLGMHFRIAVHFGSRGLEDSRSYPLGQAQHVDSPHYAGFHRFHGVVLVVNRRGWTREIKDPIDLHENGFHDIMPDQLKVGVVEEVGNIALGAREEIIQRNHLVAFGQQAFAEKGAEEAGASGDKGAFCG